VPWKYERVTLLIVDFEQDPPVVIDNMETFLKERMVSANFANYFTFESLNIQNFFDEIYKATMNRYYLLLGKKL